MPARSGLVLKNGSVARLKTSGLIPHPVSRIATTSQFRESMAVATSIVPTPLGSPPEHFAADRPEHRRKTGRIHQELPGSSPDRAPTRPGRGAEVFSASSLFTDQLIEIDGGQLRAVRLTGHRGRATASQSTCAQPLTLRVQSRQSRCRIARARRGSDAAAGLCANQLGIAHDRAERVDHMMAHRRAKIGQLAEFPCIIVTLWCSASHEQFRRLDI